MTDLVDAVLAACDRHGEAPALTRRSSSGRRPRADTLTYAELGTRVRATASGLSALGLRPGDRVLFSVRPGPEAVILALGIVRAGGAAVFADPGAGEALFRARVALASPRWVAAEALLYLASTPLLRPLARRRGLDLPDYGRVVPDARHLRVGGWLPGVPRHAVNFRAVLRSPHSAEPRRSSSGEALIVFTSGTTDAPRAVVHTRASLGASLGAIATSVMRPGQRVLTDQLMVGIPALLAGAHWTMPPPGLDPGARPEAYLPLLADADVLFASPAAMHAILRRVGEGAAPRLETVILGGAPVLRPLLERVRAAFPAAGIRAVYGMTELLPIAIADGAEKLARPDAEGDWVGRLVPGVTARVDGDELVVAGPGMASHLGEATATEVRTGDLARLDDGGLTLLGRKKDMYIRGTQNVYPGLYEPLIASLPGVSDALLAGVPDEIGDDRLVLLVVPVDAPAHPDAAHPVALSVARALPGLLDVGVLPEAVVAVPDLPRTGRSRKLDRRAAAELARVVS